tara:strand:+ start:368 stop:577 length:210 start_codon:yes stop_codon:yes gene_type:complete
MLDNSIKKCYSITTMNNEPMTYEETYGYDYDEDKNEQDRTTERLLDSVCEGVILPTEEEEQEALETQHN